MANAKILVIDDQTGPRESLRMILKDTYEVRLSEGPIEGLKAAREYQPDVVFLDIKMPEMEGPEVLRRLKEIDPRVEVALVTAFAHIDTAQQAVRYGAIDYIKKPFAVKDILDVAQRAVDRRREHQREQSLLQQLQPAAAVLTGHLDALGGPSVAPDQGDIYLNLAEAHSSIETQLTKIGRLNAIGEIAAEVAHDVSNFLTAILLRIEMLLMNLKQSEEVDSTMVRDALRDIVQAARDGAEAVQRISGISKADPYEPSQVLDIDTVIADVVNMSVGQFKESRGVRIDVQTSPCAQVYGSPAALRTAIMNIVINARHAIEGPGQVSIRTYMNGDSVVIEVADTGIGIPEDMINRITEPFFTTKGEKGSGLGLSVARKVFAQHGGTIQFYSVVGEGTTVTIKLPGITGGEASESSDAGPKASRRVVPNVLVIDDDQKLLNGMIASLVGAGLSAEGAADAAEGLRKFEEYLEKEGTGPGVVITDLRMPGLLGTDMARRVKEMVPETFVILMSAYVTEQAELVNCPYLDAIVRKPFEIADLIEQVRKGI